MGEGSHVMAKEPKAPSCLRIPLESSSLETNVLVHVFSSRHGNISLVVMATVSSSITDLI